MKGGEARRSRGTRRGSGRKRETIVRVSLVDQREMRIARLGWPLGRLSWGPNRVREVGRSVSPSPFIFLLSSSASSSLPPTLAERPSRFYFVCAPRVALSRSPPPLFLSLPLTSLSLSLSLSQGENGSWPFPSADFAANPARRRIDLYSFILRLHLLSRSCRFIRHASSIRSLRSRGFSSRYSFLYARDCIVRSFNALCNGISVFYRLDYYHHLLSVFSPSPLPFPLSLPCPPPPRRSFVTL